MDIPVLESDDWELYIWRIRNKWAIYGIIQTYGIEWAIEAIEDKQDDFTAEFYMDCYETNNNN